MRPILMLQFCRCSLANFGYITRCSFTLLVWRNQRKPVDRSEHTGAFATISCHLSVNTFDEFRVFHAMLYNHYSLTSTLHTALK